MMKTAGTIGLGLVQTVVAPESAGSYIFVQIREHGRLAVVSDASRVVVGGFSAHAPATAIAGANYTLQSSCFAAFARWCDDAIDQA